MFPNTGEFPLPGYRRSKTPYFFPENSEQRWLPEPETVFQRPRFKIDYRKHIVLLRNSTLDQVSLFHLLTHSVPTASHPALSTAVWWMMQSWIQGVYQLNHASNKSANTHRIQNAYTFKPENEANPYRSFCSVLLPPPARRGATASTQ